MLARCLLSGDHAEEIRIFYSYARKDEQFRASIDDVLARFKWDVDVRTWYDGEIPAGTEWEENIFRNIDAADIILLFVTRHFMTSAYCRDVEVPRALARQEANKATVIPVLVESIDLDRLDPRLRKLQFLPRNGVAVSAWSDQKAAVRSIIQGIVDIIAGASLDPTGRCRWQMRLRGELQEMDETKQHRIIQELRFIADDHTLRPLALGDGSVVMFMESSRVGFARLKGWHTEQAEPIIGGFELLDVIQLFGAGIQASATTVADSTPDASGEHTPSLLFPSAPYVPTLAKGIVIRDAAPLQPNFIVDTGDVKLDPESFSAESARLTEYFLTAVAAPDNESWVNLSPDETNRMLAKPIAGTTLGRTLLESDLKLKRLAASLLHPDCDTGRRYWDAVFRGSSESTNPPRDYATFQRVWLVPSKAVVFHPDNQIGQQGAFVVEQRIAVLSEDDYLTKYATGPDRTFRQANEVCTPAFKEIVIPVIEKEVNEGRHFAEFRQIYYCMILASWLKNHFREHPSWAKFIDSGNPRQLAHSINHQAPANVKRMLQLPDDADSRPDAAAPLERITTPPQSDEPDEPDERLIEEGARLREAGRHEESLRILQDVCAAYGRHRGSSSQQTQISMIQLGRTLRAMDRVEEARQLHAEVLRVRRHVLGDDHPYTIDSMEILAATLQQLGDIDGARKLRGEMDDRKARSSEGFSIRENREFYEEYMRVFRNGVFRLTRSEYVNDANTSSRVVRSYFSGAIDLRTLRTVMTRTTVGGAKTIAE
jgi:hypothetical protein